MHSQLQQNFNAYLHRTGELSTGIAIASFAIGTILFGAHKLGMGGENLLVFGFMYVCVAALLNLLVLLNLIFLFIIESRYREYFAIKILIVLANIPIAIAYFCLLFHASVF